MNGLYHRDPSEFRIHPKNVTLNDLHGCKENLDNILSAIVAYYSKTRGWELESNIPVHDIFIE